MQQVSVPLRPKNPDGPLQVLIIGRISTEYQNEENIEASYRFVEDYLKQIHADPLSISHLGECGSGMLTDRASIREAEELVATGKIAIPGTSTTLSRTLWTRRRGSSVSATILTRPMSSGK